MCEVHGAAGAATPQSNQCVGCLQPCQCGEGGESPAGNRGYCILVQKTAIRGWLVKVCLFSRPEPRTTGLEKARFSRPCQSFYSQLFQRGERGEGPFEYCGKSVSANVPATRPQRASWVIDVTPAEGRIPESTRGRRAQLGKYVSLAVSTAHGHVQATQQGAIERHPGRKNGREAPTATSKQ